MKHALLTSAALVLMEAAGQSFAADLPAPIAPPVFTWTGLYVGFNSGFSWRNSANINTATNNVLDAGLIPGQWGAASAQGATGIVSSRLNGFMSGGQAGYNWQFSDKFVAGLEADIQAGGVNGGGGFHNVTATALDSATAQTNVSVNRRLDYLGTVRARLGYALTPATLVYATGGLAYGGVDLTTTIRQNLSPSLLFSKAAKGDLYENRAGWTVGAGLEYAFAPNLSGKIEYDYYDLGTAGSNAGQLAYTDIVTGAVRVADASSSSTRYNGHLIRAGLNYRLGGTAPNAADSGATPLFAAPQFIPAAPPAPGWQFTLTPYMWAMGLNGTTTTRGQTVDTNASFLDILTKSSSFPIAFMGHFEARNGPIALYTDLVFAQLRFAGSMLKQATRFPDLALSVDANAHLRATMGIVEAGGAYELARWTQSGAGDSFTAIDALGGLRYWNVSATMGFDVTGSVDSDSLGLSRVGSRANASSGSIQWIDPVIGFRLRQQVAAGDEFQFRGDIGGFGLGSKFSWQAFGGYSHEFKLAGLTFAGVVGYRALYADFSEGGGLNQKGLNAILHGPVAGISVPF
ncbi:outer membrane protein [Methylocapsa palsarum]|uniref:Opacity protein n=1 Tax=Methylocapsa palsarum TaxID=1612308 RepID=A0A1I4A7H2_9HYPH|nr:outer membrane beta-barrel protein [Methylocapsa palsarum]SFK51786.1 Opacity protein [Methylocapsa palsarum]